MGAILVQAVRWENASRAVENLKRAGILDSFCLAEIDLDHLSGLIRPSGYHNAKARKLRQLALHLVRNHGGRIESLLDRSPEEARQELLSVWGVGPETADSILLYGGGHPAFVVDAYTGRIMQRLGLWSGRGGYEGLKKLFSRNLPEDPGMFCEYHALLVRLAKKACFKSDPLCGACPIGSYCSSGGDEQGTGPSS